MSLAATRTGQVRQVSSTRLVLQRQPQGTPGGLPATATGTGTGSAVARRPAVSTAATAAVAAVGTAAGAGVAPAAGVDRGDQAGQRPVLPGRLEIMIALVEQLTGRPVRVVDPASLGGERYQAGASPPAPGASASPPTAGARAATSASAGARAAGGLPPGWSIDAESVVVTAEHAETGFTATGRVVDTDGREISFSVGFRLARDSVQVARAQTRVAGTATVDPLVIGYGGGPVALAGTTVDLDLTGDGVAERVAFVGAGSGFLALDRNGNGRVDGGGELFGPATGDGYAELAGYDDDGNGWIDAGDAVYADLRLWDEASGRLKTLAERGVGAVGLANTATPWQLTAGGQPVGVLRSSGVWLGTGGAAGVTGHVDLAV